MTCDRAADLRAALEALIRDPSHLHKLTYLIEAACILQRQAVERHNRPPIAQGSPPGDDKASGGVVHADEPSPGYRTLERPDDPRSVPRYPTIAAEDWA